MTLTSLTSNELKQVARLVEQRQPLAAKLAEIDRQLAGFEGGTSKPDAAARRGPTARGLRRQPRGAVKQAILDLIKGRGRQGITVREIAAALGVSANRVHTWFYNTGRSVEQIRKIGGATYRWSA
jgi:hypothetical protein